MRPPQVRNRTILFASLLAGFALAALPAAAQNCKRNGSDVTCDDGRVGIFTGDAIVWADGTQSRAASQSPSVIIGNRSSVQVGQGVFVGTCKGTKQQLEDPSKKRCAVLDGVNYCN